MSTIIIGGGGGKAAIDRLVAASGQMNADERTAWESLLSNFAKLLNIYVDMVAARERMH